jgi:hypothetical protein
MSLPRSHHWLVVVVWAVMLLAPSLLWSQARYLNPQELERIEAKHRDLSAEYLEKLRRLSQDCEANGDVAGVAEIRRYQTPPAPGRIQVSTLPDQVQPPLPANLPALELQWRTELERLRRNYALQLYLLSRRSLHANSPGLAYDLIHELVIHDPDHEKARELLGYVRFNDEWVSPFAKKMQLAGNEWHPQFGWLPKKHLPRYIDGERFVDGKWMSAEKEAAIRQDFHHAWTVKTDHYEIKTNVSLEQGVALGQALEQFHEFFHQTFAGFFNEPEQLRKIFDGTARTVNRTAQQYRVHFYRTRKEYVSRLKPVFPAIEATNGIYLTGDRTAHFYADEKYNAEDTLFHEATHQLFYESHLQHREIAEGAHFWIVEGIACYFESFRHGPEGFSIGDPGHIRFVGARRNFLDLAYYIPLAEFEELGKNEFQGASTEALPKNYTQAAGLAHFFMQYNHGIYRDAVVTHLSQIYSGDARKRQFTQGLSELTGVSREELDRQYGEWLKELQAQEAAAASIPPEN